MSHLPSSWLQNNFLSATSSPVEIVDFTPKGFSSFRTRLASEMKDKDPCVRTIASILVDAQKLGKRTDTEFSFPDRDVRLKAHRFILALGSPVFDTMLYGPEWNCANPIEITDASPEDFSLLLEFLYTREWPRNEPVKAAVEVIYIAKKYMVEDLINCIQDQLQDSISLETVLPIMKAAIFFEFSDLESKCWECLEIDAHRLLLSEPFLSLDIDLVTKVLKRDNLNISEGSLWEALLRWGDAECDRQHLERTLENRKAVLGDSYKHIRFPLMGPSEFMSGPAVSGILSQEEVINCLVTKYGKSPTDPPLFPTTKRTFQKPFQRMDCRCKLSKIPCFFCKNKDASPRPGKESDESSRNASPELSHNTPKAFVLSTGIPTIYCVCRSRDYCPTRRIF